MCKNPDCGSGKKVFSRGYCQACYYRLRRRGTLERKNAVGGSRGVCSRPGCHLPAHARFLCSRHYQQDITGPLRTLWSRLRSRALGAYPDEWNEFDAFVEAIGEMPSSLHQLRRPNPEAPWSTVNMEWVEPVGIGTTTREDMAKYAWAWHLRRKYGLTPERVIEMAEEQDGECPICETPLDVIHPDTGKPVRICVDHDHETGAVRSLLHDHCNKGLGCFGDSADNCRRAAAYLDHHAKGSDGLDG